MIEETDVLDRHDGVAKAGRHPVERNLYPVLCRDGRDEPIVHVVEDGALGGFTQLAQFGLAGQAGENLVHEPAGQDGAERQ